jgi:hypothetical protein
MPKIGAGRGPGLTLVAGLGAALPVIVSTIRGLHEGATPTGDRAIIATRAYDVLSTHTPLVGQFSASSVLYKHVIHSLGPLLYWLLALPARFGSPAAPAVAIALVNVLAILGTVALARRRGGVALMLAAAVAVALMCRSLAPQTLHDIWNPSAGLLPFTLLIFLCWSLACGEHRLLPLAVLVASFTAQCELVFLAPSAGMLAVGIAGLAVSHRAERKAARPGPVGASATPAGGSGNGNSERRRSTRRWWLAALLVGLVCWSGPIVDEIRGHPGNLTLVARAAFSHGQTLGATAGWRAVVRAVGIPPWWLTAPSDPFSRLADVRSAPGELAVISCVALLCALLVVALIGLRRRRRDVSAGALIGLVLCLSLAAVTSSTPTRSSLVKSLGYTLWFGSPAGMWVWLVLGWSTATLYGARLRRVARTGAGRLVSERAARLPRVRTRAPTIAASLGLAAALAVGAAVASGQGPDQDQPEYTPVKTVNAAVDRALAPTDHTVLVTGSHSFTAFDFRAAVIYDLRRRGLRVVAPAASVRLGAYYEPDGRTPDASVYVFDERSPPRRGRVIARVSFGGAPRKTITVMLAPAGARPAPARRRRVAP